MTVEQKAKVFDALVTQTSPTIDGEVWLAVLNEALNVLEPKKEK